MFRKSVIFLSLLLSGGVAVAADWTSLDPARLQMEYLHEEKGQARKESFRGKHVQYFATPEERARYRVQIKEGVFYDAEGKRLDTQRSQMKKFSGQIENSSHAMVVYGKDEKIYVSTWSEAGKFHHSTFFAGEPVLFAGEIGVQDGRLVFLNESSGHYKPSVRHALRMMSEFEQAGVDVSRVQFTVTRPEIRDFTGYSYEQFLFRKPNAQELEEFTRYALSDFIRCSYRNENLMPMLLRYEREIKENLIRDPRALEYFLNTLDQSLSPAQESLVSEALRQHRKMIFEDVARTRALNRYFSKPLVHILNQANAFDRICKIPHLIRGLFK